jgi:hypothetical protein
MDKIEAIKSQKLSPAEQQARRTRKALGLPPKLPPVRVLKPIKK